MVVPCTHSDAHSAKENNSNHDAALHQTFAGVPWLCTLGTPDERMRTEARRRPRFQLFITDMVPNCYTAKASWQMLSAASLLGGDGSSQPPPKSLCSG